MPRSPTTYVLPPGTTPQAPNTTIGSAMFNAAMDDIATTFNTAQPIAFGGTGATSVIGGWDALNAIGADIATSGTINLTTATGPNLTLTGTTTVTTVTLGEGNMRFVRANAAFQLTASANLIVNGSASSNYTTTAGDLLIFIGAAASVVRVWAISGSVQAASLAEVLAGVVANKYVSPATAYLPTGFLYGLTLTNAAGDPTNDILVAVGSARDSTDSYNYLLGSALTKQTDVAWALGTNAGSLDTGAIGNNRYAIWGIGRSDTRAGFDVLTSLSFTTPTMPANYDFKVLIGEFTRAGGVNGTPLWYGPRIASGLYVNGSYELVASIAASSSSTINFDSSTGVTLEANYDYIIKCSRVKPSADGNVQLQFGTGGTPTYQTTSYTTVALTANGSAASVATDSTTSAVLVSPVTMGGASAGEYYSSEIVIDEPAANDYHPVTTNGTSSANNATMQAFQTGGRRSVQEVVTGIRLQPSTGNFTTGTFTLYRERIR